MSTDPTASPTPDPAPTPNARPRSAPGVHPRPFWSLRPASDRESGDAVVSNFLLHWFPAKSYKPSLSWGYSFWLGTISAALLLLLTVSGLPLLFLYIPSVERAYASVKDIEYVITFGFWIRAVHRISAHLMVAVVFLHMARVFLTGAYKNGVGRSQRREWNWVLGVLMLLATLFRSFTGYLLPWDQLAFWAVTVGPNIASSIPWVGPKIRELLIGGRAIEQPTLIRFYVLHVLFLPGGLAGLFLYHMWRIRKDGGLARADGAVLLEARGTTVNSVPDLVRRAAIVILGTIAAVSILSVFLRSPLEEPANALVTPNPAKAPWYFLWLQEIVTDTTVRIGSFTINGAFIGGVILPGILVTLLTLWPWIDRRPIAAAGLWLPRS